MLGGDLVIFRITDNGQNATPSLPNHPPRHVQAISLVVSVGGVAGGIKWKVCVILRVQQRARGAQNDPQTRHFASNVVDLSPLPRSSSSSVNNMRFATLPLLVTLAPSRGCASSCCSFPSSFPSSSTPSPSCEDSSTSKTPRIRRRRQARWQARWRSCRRINVSHHRTSSPSSS